MKNILSPSYAVTKELLDLRKQLAEKDNRIKELEGQLKEILITNNMHEKELEGKKDYQKGWDDAYSHINKTFKMD